MGQSGRSTDAESNSELCACRCRAVLPLLRGEAIRTACSTPNLGLICRVKSSVDVGRPQSCRSRPIACGEGLKDDRRSATGSNRCKTETEKSKVAKRLNRVTRGRQRRTVARIVSGHSVIDHASDHRAFISGHFTAMGRTRSWVSPPCPGDRP